MRRLVVADSIRTPSGSPGNALLIGDGQVIAAGDATELDAPLVDRYPGGVLVPGFRDAHIHPLAYATAGMVLEGVTDFADLRDRIRETFPDRVVVGMRLDETRLKEGHLPTRYDLDAFEHPVLLYRVCGHIAVANTAALTIAGVGPDVTDPPGGIFDRDADGVPNGILRETAITFVASRLPIRPPRPADVIGTLAELTRLGITAIGGVFMSSWSEHPEVLTEMADDLPLRIHAIVETSSPTDLAVIARKLDHRRLTFAGVKEFADGSLGGRTAALRRPYDDEPSTSGMLRLTRDAVPRARVALEHDGIVAVHAIGDLAVARVLDLFETLIAEGADPHRLRVEHASMTSDEDIRRMADLGVTACIQPSFVPSDAPWLPRRIGAERAAGTYRFASMQAAGIPLCGGSDAPVESPDPLLGIAAARDRGGFTPDEALTAEQALALFTTSGALLLGEPPPLSPGSPADFVVLDRDPLLSSPMEIREAHVLATWVDGQEVSGFHS